MDLSAWVWYPFIVALVMAASLAHYRWREPDVSGRTVLGLLRGAALSGIVLLLFDPVIPAVSGHRGPVVALLDASLSMSLVDDEGVSRWERAVELVEELGPDRIQPFGGAEVWTVSDPNDAAPTSNGSRLAPAVRGAVESGAGRVVVVTDGAVEDAPEARRIAGESAVPIAVRVVGRGTRANLALEAVDGSAWLEVGEEAVVRVVAGRVGVSDGLPDSATVTLSLAGRTLARERLPVPPAGRSVAVELRFRPESASPEPVRLDVRIESGGAAADDDVRSLYVRIGEEPAGVVLLALRPDQEPRFLLPILERSLGLPVRGWTRLPDGRLLSVAAGPEAGVATPEGVVRAAVSGSTVLVLHGVDGDAPAWVWEALVRVDRLLVFPSGPVPGLPVVPGPARDGEWYPAGDLPPSPVAPLLAGVSTAGVPPLPRLRATDLPEGYWTPLRARLGRRGEARPVVAVGREGERRVAVALADGYWRWAFAGPEGRALYEQLWAAVVGWLLEDAGGLDAEPVSPVARVVERGASVGWRVVGTGDSVSVRIALDGEGAAGGVSRDTTVAVVDGRAVTGPLPPGHYRYEARTMEGDRVQGAFTVASYSPELLHPVVELEPVLDGRGDGIGGREGRPLRATPWAYIFIVTVLCVEWVLRRRWGLR